MNKIRPILFFLLVLASPILFAQKTPKEKKDPKDDDGGKPSGIVPVLIRGPYLQSATPTGILIRWRTDASSRSRVRFGSEKGMLNKVADDSSLVTEHQVRL